MNIQLHYIVVSKRFGSLIPLGWKVYKTNQICESTLQIFNKFIILIIFALFYSQKQEMPSI